MFHSKIEKILKKKSFMPIFFKKRKICDYRKKHGGQPPLIRVI